MPAPSWRKHALGNDEDKCPLSRHLQRVRPLSIHKSSPVLTFSSLSASQNSNDSSLDSSISSSDVNQEVNRDHVSFHYGTFASSWGRRERGGGMKGRVECGDIELLNDVKDCLVDDVGITEDRSKRCNWITKSSDEVYVTFHDERWGVPTFNDSQLFELLALSGMLIDHNWTEILKRRERYREVFAKFDYNIVATMDEKDVMEISSDRGLILAESRVRCIVDNAKCIQKVANESGSFSSYIWDHVNHRPTINKHSRSIPLRSLKSEAISKDLLRRGFRLVGPVIIYSFMQAAGMTIDHLTNCFRYRECVRIAQRSWIFTDMAT